jgi:hypothetical protein
MEEVMTFQTAVHVPMNIRVAKIGQALDMVQYRDGQEFANRLFPANTLAPFALFKLFT